MNHCNIAAVNEDELSAKKLSMLGHPVRLAIIRLLVRAGPGGLAAGNLGNQLKTAPNALTFHLQKLVHVGLATSRREGQFIIYSAVFDALTQLTEMLVSTCCADSVEKCGPDCPTNESTAANLEATPRNLKRNAQ